MIRQHAEKTIQALTHGHIRQDDCTVKSPPYTGYPYKGYTLGDGPVDVGVLSYCQKAQLLSSELWIPICMAITGPDFGPQCRDASKPEKLVREDVDIATFKEMWCTFVRTVEERYEYTDDSGNSLRERRGGGLQMDDLDNVPAEIRAEAERVIEFWEAAPPPDRSVLARGSGETLKAEARYAANRDWQKVPEDLRRATATVLGVVGLLNDIYQSARELLSGGGHPKAMYSLLCRLQDAVVEGELLCAAHRVELDSASSQLGTMSGGTYHNPYSHSVSEGRRVLEAVAVTDGSGVVRERIADITFPDARTGMRGVAEFIAVWAEITPARLTKLEEHILGVLNKAWRARLAEKENPQKPTYVTLKEAAELAHTSKKTLEDWKSKGKFPAPTQPHSGRRPARWQWDTLRPVLEKLTGLQLPECPRQ